MVKGLGGFGVEVRVCRVLGFKDFRYCIVFVFRSRLLLVVFLIFSELGGKMAAGAYPAKQNKSLNVQKLAHERLRV